MQNAWLSQSILEVGYLYSPLSAVILYSHSKHLDITSKVILSMFLSAVLSVASEGSSASVVMHCCTMRLWTFSVAACSDLQGLRLNKINGRSSHV